MSREAEASQETGSWRSCGPGGQILQLLFPALSFENLDRNYGKILDLAWKEPLMSESRNKILALKDESYFVVLCI